MASQTKGFLRDFLRDTSHLEHHSAGTDNRDPILRGTFSGTHTGLSRLCSHRLIREDLDPDFAATLCIDNEQVPETNMPVVILRTLKQCSNDERTLIALFRTMEDKALALETLEKICKESAEKKS